LTDYTCGSGSFGKDVAERRMQPLRLRTLLRQAAAAMTVYGRDSIPYGELEQRLSELVEKSLMDEVRELDRENPISGLVISFFFKGGQRELGAEFTHKSFREYLAAEAVIETLKEYGRTCQSDLPERPRREYWKEYDASDPRFRLARRLGKILGAQWVVPEVAGHLKGLIEWEIQRARTLEGQVFAGSYPTEPVDLTGWRRIRDGLADLWDWWGEGVHLRPQPQMRGRRFDGLEPPYVQDLIDWHIHQDRSGRDYEPWSPRTTTIDAVLGDALCRLAGLVHRHVAGVADARWMNEVAFDGQPPHTPRRYQSWDKIDGEWQLRFKPSGEDPDYFRYYCNRINAAGPRPDGQFPRGVYLAGADFNSCSLYRVEFTYCDLNGANLGKTNLSQAFAAHANFKSASFREAAMLYGAFIYVNFEQANFAEANAFGAAFLGSNLGSADFSDAKLEYADLRECDTTGANFSTANLDGIRGLSQDPTLNRGDIAGEANAAELAG
jgi:hypothetical protein